MGKRVLLVLIVALITSCSAKIEPYYIEYVFEMRNGSGVDVEVTVKNNSSLSDIFVLRNGENVKWRTNSGLYTWPFDNVDTLAVDVYYNDIYLVRYGSGDGFVSARNPGDRTNYVQKKIDESTYSFVYSFTEDDYKKAQGILK